MAKAEAAQTSGPTKITVRRVESGAQQQLDDFKSMTKSYLEWLGEDLGFQGIERELASLPGSYADEQGGCMLLAYESSGDAGGSGGEECVGAVALRRLAGHTNTVQDGESVAGVPLERVCEMKRLFVLPGHHGRGVGAALCSELLAQAAELGYQVCGC
jgi:GNAT superfamily N-acetyltransferase